MTLETTHLFISRFWSLSWFHHIIGIVVVSPTKVFQNSLQHFCPLHKMGWTPSQAKTYWYQTCTRSWSDKWFCPKLGHWKVGWSEDIMVPFLFQYGRGAACQDLHNSNLFLQHDCRAASHVLNESNSYQQSGGRADCQVPNEWNLLSQHRCGGNCRVFKKTRLTCILTTQLQSSRPSFKQIKLIPGLGQKSSSDPNWATEKSVGVKT